MLQWRHSEFVPIAGSISMGVCLLKTSLGSFFWGKQRMSRSSRAVSCCCLTTICLLCTTPLLAAVPTEYQPNYDLGYSDGYPVGYDLGFATGQERGQTEGTAAGEDAGYQQGWDDAYQPAYDLAYDAQYPLGVDRGYVDGFPDGFVEGYHQGPEIAAALGGSLVLWNDSISGYPSGTIIGTLTATNDWSFTYGGSGAGGVIMSSGVVTTMDYDWVAHYYRQGYGDGRDAGFPVGSQAGYDAVYPLAYAVAFDLAYPEGVDDGTAEGKLVGGQIGFGDGWDAGFDDGHSDGFGAGVQYYLYGAFDVPDRLLSSAAAAVSVPEPATLPMLGMAVVIGWSRCRRRRRVAA
jgi:hypothetical protein